MFRTRCCLRGLVDHVSSNDILDSKGRMTYNDPMIQNLKNFDLKQIEESGQCFRMKMTDDSHAVVVARGKILEIRHVTGDTFEFDCSGEDFDNIWYDYFDLGTDYEAFISTIPKKDLFLQKAAQAGRGIRILRQDPFETLITFIISQRKSIPAIKTSVERLCRICGNLITDGIYAFPEAGALADLSESDLSSCALGYRAPYVRNAAEMVCRGGFDLSAASQLEDKALLERLKTLKGVGDKVANCVMLFAYHRTGAFPVDVWISRIVDEYYQGHFPLDRYEGYAGIMQQYMFYYRKFM